MNEYASMPWYVRYLIPALVFTLVGITNPEIPWWGDVGIFVGTFCVFMVMQACIDGWHPSKW